MPTLENLANHMAPGVLTNDRATIGVFVDPIRDCGAQVEGEGKGHGWSAKTYAPGKDSCPNFGGGKLEESDRRTNQTHICALDEAVTANSQPTVGTTLERAHSCRLVEGIRELRALVAKAATHDAQSPTIPSPHT